MAEYSPGYPVNTNPGPAGDTVKEAVEKHISEFLKAYADLTTMYQQILVELEYANVDTVDGKHADNTANNLPVLNGSSELVNNINNSSVKTAALEVSGTTKVKDLVLTGQTTLVSDRIKINVGVITNGQTIPLPVGYTQEQCAWFVIPRMLIDNVSPDDIQNFTCQVDENRLVKLLIEGKVSSTSTATYVIIGVK